MAGTCTKRSTNCGTENSIKNNQSRGKLLSILFFLALLAPFQVHCKTSGNYTVEITGAGELAPILNDYLEINRQQNTASLSREELQRLVNSTPQQIRELLATQGYFSPAIEHALVPDGAGWIARFNVDPGPPTHVDSVDLRFDGDLARGPHADEERMDRLRQIWLLKPGEQFKQSMWDEAKLALLKNLLNRDYPAAKIAQSEARIEPEKHSATLVVEVDSGPFFTFGALQIQGLHRYSRETIDLLNPIQPGEPFSQEKLTELQARLQDSGYFKTVFATIEADPEHPDHVPVRVDLSENKRRNLALGIGYSTDTGPRAQVKWLDRSFFGYDWRLESALRIDSKTPLAGADLYFPALENGWHPSLGAHVERTDIAGEVDDRMRLDARVTSPLKTDEKTWGVSYLTERQYIAQTIANNRQALIASWTYTARRVDNLISPHRGYVAALEVAAGPRGILNEANIGRVTFHLNYLSPMADRWQAVLRGQAGQVIGAARERVPSDLLFRTGGDQSVRGYAFESLGIEQNGAVVGGRVVAVASAELVYSVTPTWGAAVFRDAGNAADSWREFRLKQGTGIGARWRSPIGPINIDLAYGHATHQPRLHFSVGYGF